tara:strand:- start:1808 stop:1975 length:168 start_codon:yes stop_codon:yes gene_type:complete
MIAGCTYKVRYWDEWKAIELIYLETRLGFYIFLCPDTKIEFKVRPSSADIRKVEK